MSNGAVTTTGQIFPISEVQTMARAIAECGLFGVKTPAQAFGLMLVAQAEGRHPATVAQEYDIIQGRPALKAQAALARFQAAGGSIQWTERTDKSCAAKFSHPSGGTLEIRWDMARAQAAQLTGKDNWRKFPAQMLAARVVAEGVRAVFPACLNGVYLAEEVQDFDPRPEPISTPAVIVTEEPKKPRPIPEEKARELARRAADAGFTEEQVRAALGDDLTSVTAPKARAFFALVEAEEAAYAERMAAESEPLEGEVP